MNNKTTHTHYATVSNIITFAGCILLLAIVSLTTRTIPKHNTDDDTPDAYILQKPGTVVAAWRYNQLPMHNCAWCKRTVNLNRHHVVPQAANPELAHVRDNLIVLCRDCHFVLGHRCDFHQYNPDVMFICTHFTNCVRSADTRYALTNKNSTVESPVEVPVSTNTVIPNTDNILHVTNDVPEKQRSALERILKWGNQ